MQYLIALAGALILNAIANLLMKIGMKDIYSSGGLLKDGIPAAVRTVAGNGTLLIGLTCFAMNAFLYMYALQSPTLKISIAYPIMVGGGYALIAVIAHWHPALGESLNTMQMLGVALILLGIVFITSQIGISKA